MSQTFRPRSNFVWAGISFVLIALFAVNSFYVTESALQKITEIIICIALCVVVYVIWVRPKLIVGEHSVEVINPFSNEVVGFHEIIELDTKWALTIVHSRGKTRVWVAPASGKRRWIADATFGFYGRGVPLSDSKTFESESMSASLNSHSGQAAYLIREQMKRLH